MPYAWFQNAPIVLGRGAIEYLIQLREKRVALIADLQAIEKNGVLFRVQTALREAGAVWELICDVKHEPHMNDVDRSLASVRTFAPDTILAIGGGSALDLAKALWFFYEIPDATWEQALQPFALPPLSRQAKLIAVPTTSGTGSETTCVAVLVDTHNCKRLMISRELIPSLAILDPDVVDSMPESVASASGMDALTHALESGVCRMATSMVKAMAVESAASILTQLPLSTNVGSEPAERRKARELVHYAASRAGMAINNSSAGLAHAMDQVGPWFGLPHGLTCAILLPYTVAFIGPQPFYGAVSRMLGYFGSDPELWRHLVLRIWHLCRLLSLPAGFRECGVKNAQFQKMLDGLAQNALSSGSTKLAPATPSINDFRKMFQDAWQGQPPSLPPD